MNSQTSLNLPRLVVVGILFLFAWLANSCQKEKLFDTDNPVNAKSSLNKEGGDAITTRTNDPKLAIKVILNGPYDPGTGLMNDALRTLAAFPTTSPYGTGESISNPSTVLAVTGNNAIVDWVLVELRTSSTTIVTSASGLLQRDGDVVDMDGTSALAFPGASAAGSYQVAILHRNHLGCLTTGSFTPSVSSPPTVDLTSSSTSTWSSASAVGRRTNGSVMTLFTGDTQNLFTVVTDKRVIYSGPSNDPANIYARIMLDPGNTGPLANWVAANVYETWDVNMDGKTIYQGPDNDVAPILLSVLASPLNTTLASNFIVYQAVP